MAYYYDDLLKGMIRAQPVAVLDGLFGGNAAARQRGFNLVENMKYLRKNPLEGISVDVMLKWCGGVPEVRFPTAAARVTAFHKSTSGLQWSDMAGTLLAKAPNRVAVMKGLVSQFRPRSWSGSRAAIMEANAKLLDELESYGDSALDSFVVRERVRLTKEIEAERSFEDQHAKKTDERFE